MISFILICISSLLFQGILNRVKSIAAGRKGPDVFQPLRDLMRLFRKELVYSQTSSWIFQVAPTIQLACVIIAALMVPLGDREGMLSFTGDFILFIYVLALGKFFMLLAALDTGSSFSGMGAAREALYSLLVEPAFFILMGAFALLTERTSFHDIYQSIHFDGTIAIHFDGPITLILGLVSSAVLFVIMLVENSRIPLDDPKTHLELTMIHEVMVLDYSGPDLALIQLATALRFAIFSGLMANFFLYPELSVELRVVIFLAVQVLSAISVGWVESFRARNRMKSNSHFILTLTGVSVMIFFFVLILTHRFEIS